MWGRHRYILCLWGAREGLFPESLQYMPGPAQPSPAVLRVIYGMWSSRSQASMVAASSAAQVDGPSFSPSLPGTLF